MKRTVALQLDAARYRAARRGTGLSPLAIASAIAVVLLATSLGAADVEAATRRKNQRVRPSAASVSVQSSLARVEAQAFDGDGPADIEAKQLNDFSVFDKVARGSDVDDADHGAAARAEQLTTVATATSIIVKSRGKVTARLYKTGTLGFDPGANSVSSFEIQINVAGGQAFWSLRGTLEGHATPSGGTNTAHKSCGFAAVNLPDGTFEIANLDCEVFDAVSIDAGGLLDPGSHFLGVSADATVFTQNDPQRLDAGASFELALVVSACSVTGTPNDDPSLDGTVGDDVICGLGGADTIEALGGDDTIFGGGGPDDIAGGPGVDTIFGGDGDDVIQGGSGSDGVFGGPGEDQIFDLKGPNSLLSGGDGEDVICGSNERDIIEAGDDPDSVLGLGGRDDIDGGAGPDFLDGGDTGSIAEALGCLPQTGSPSGSQNDVIDGGPGNDDVLGSTGGDVLRGGLGKDKIDGGPGSDTINACDSVRDVVNGGPGTNDVAKRTRGLDRVLGVETLRNC